MMPHTTWLLVLKRAVPLLLLALLLVWAYQYGYAQRDAAAQVQMATVLRQHEQERLATAQEYNNSLLRVQKLAQQWRDKADRVAVDLTAANQQARRLAAENQKGIDDALAKDHIAVGECIDGFGPDSLRQYRRSLGYAD